MNPKRAYHGDRAASAKRQKFDSDSCCPGDASDHHDRLDRPRDPRIRGRRDSSQQNRCEARTHNTHHCTPHPAPSRSRALDKLPGTELPQLPPVKEEYQQTAFRHKSHYSVSRELAIGDVTYERLEFLGDAYIELFASRIIYGRYLHLPAGRMSQLRELLVKNETLAEFSRAYGFDTRVEVGGEVERMMRDSQGRGNKGYNKIVGDVFEAYVAAVVLSDYGGKGYETAEQWCTALWAPKLLNAAEEDPSYTYKPPDHEGDLSTVYDVEAKPRLQKRLCAANLVRLHYETDRPTVELKGDKLGQNVHFIALYVESTPFGIEKKLLAKGEGRNKVEAGNWAAVKAMHEPATKPFIDDLEQRVVAERERRRLESEARKKASEEVGGDDSNGADVHVW